ncbi:MAG: hypothetical protein B5M51_02125 [Anaerolinea sp. 4484_236]|nr:MAG: hypothetical protein B5M51_02125 [Anaerolinea sp. 4484_236]
MEYRSLALGKLVLQSDSDEKAAVSSKLSSDIFVVQIAIKILSLNQLDSMASDIQQTVSNYNDYLDTEEARITKTTTLYMNILIGLMLALVLGVTLFASFNILRPIRNLTDFAETLTQGVYDQNINIRSHDEFGQLGHTFNTLSTRLNDLITNLENRISERTSELKQRSAYLEGSAEISRAASSILDTNTLIKQVVQLIKERFNFYYVGLFLVDARNEWAVLQAGTGEAGQKMLARNHRLKIGEGMIGWSIANAEARIALDVGKDAVRFENPDLPETRSEGALPLRSRGHVLGALTIQSTEEAAFNQDILTTLQTMTDQVAVALDNAELLAKSEAALEAERKAYGELSKEDWKELARGQTIPRYRSDAPDTVYPITEKERPEAAQTAPDIQDNGLTITIPIKSHDYTLGGVALESARLYSDTQRRAAHEQLISETTARIRETLDMDTIMKTAAEEIRQSLDLPEVVVQLIPPQKVLSSEEKTA